MIGKKLGQYEILDKLGQGGMGEVWRARDTKLGREVALKLLPEDLAGDPERRARFEREARAIAALSHPHIVTIFAVEEIEGRPLLAMELVEGHTLSEIISEGGLPLGRLLELAVPLTDALATAHARGITHRDLKPQNVMVDRAGRIRVLDFGLAKLMDAPQTETDDTLAVDVTGEGKVIGTAAYMAPEQAEGKPVDPRSDVFTLGILLYQMATGEKPFAGDTPISTITAILRDEPVPMRELKPDLPAQLGRIVKRCLEKDPERRYDTAKGLKFELESLHADSTESTPAMAPAAAKPRNNWLMSAVIAALLLGVVIVFALQMRDKVEDRPEQLVEQTPVTPTAPGPEQSIPTIVVFPFENLGPAEDEYFAGGITDEITTRLVGTRGLAVLSRSSARQYEREGKTMQQIAEDLGVEYVLEGSVRWQHIDDDNSQVRVSPLLVHAPNDRQLWANSYDRSMEQIFAIQTEIASEVANQIGAAILPIAGEPESPPTRNMQAYHLFLRAKNPVDHGQLQIDEWEPARRLLEDAVELDPEFAEAWSYLARTEAGFCHFNWDRSEKRLEAARRALARTHEIAPDSIEDYLARGYVYYWGEKRFEEATAAFEAALALRPADTETMEALAYVARREGRFADALVLLEKAARATPNSWRMAFNVAETLGSLRRHEEAIAAADRTIALEPAAVGGYLVKGMVLANTGQLDEAIATVKSSPRQTGDISTFFADLALYHGRYEEARELLADMSDYRPLQFGDRSRVLFEAKLIHFSRGRNEAAEAYEHAVASLRKTVADNPREPNPRSLLAEALAGIGQCEEAISLAEEATILFPADRDVWFRSYREWNLARVHLLCGNVDEAEEIIQRLCAGDNIVISRAYLRNSKLFQADGPVPEFRVVAEFEL